MHNQVKPQCFQCKKTIQFTPRYCCNPAQVVCSLCSSQICKKCNRRRTSIEMNRVSQQRYNIIKCAACSSFQKSEKAQFFNQPKCKQYLCYSCMITCFQRTNYIISTMKTKQGMTLELPVELPCGCQIQNNSIVDYLKKYCYICSQKPYGLCIQLSNGCKITRRCYNDLKLSAEYKRASREDKIKFARIQQKIMKCMNCQTVIDGQIKPLGKKIDDLYICAICKVIAENGEQRFKNYPQFDPKLEVKSQQQQKDFFSKKKKEMPIKIDEKQQNRVENNKKIEQSKDSKAHLINGEKYYQSKCNSCNIKIESTIKYKSICDKCSKQRQLGSQKVSQNSNQKLNKYEILENQNNLLLNDYLPRKQRPKSKKQLINHQKMGLQSVSLQEKKQKIPLLQKQQEKSQSDPSIKQKQQLRQINNQQKQLIEQVGSKGFKNLQLKKKQSSINQEFFPPKIEKLRIYLDFERKMIKCCKCSYQIYLQHSYSSYQKQQGNQSTLRIFQTQEEKQKCSKQNKLQYLCSSCYFSIKIKLKNAKEKKQQEYESNRYRSVPKRAKKVEDYVPLTFTNVKKVEPVINNYIKQERKDCFCKKCIQFFYARQFVQEANMCKNCVQKKQNKPKAQCKRCNNYFIKSNTLLGTNNPYCLECEIAIYKL